jgi:hypothetical protein
MIAPKAHIGGYERHLADHESAARILRLHPRDFYID